MILKILEDHNIKHNFKNRSVISSQNLQRLIPFAHDGWETCLSIENSLIYQDTSLISEIQAKGISGLLFITPNQAFFDEKSLDQFKPIRLYYRQSDLFFQDSDLFQKLQVTDSFVKIFITYQSYYDQ